MQNCIFKYVKRINNYSCHLIPFNWSIKNVSICIIFNGFWYQSVKFCVWFLFTLFDEINFLSFKKNNCWINWQIVNSVCLNSRVNKMSSTLNIDKYLYGNGIDGTLHAFYWRCIKMTYLVYRFKSIALFNCIHFENIGSE